MANDDGREADAQCTVHNNEFSLDIQQVLAQAAKAAIKPTPMPCCPQAVAVIVKQLLAGVPQQPKEDNLTESSYQQHRRPMTCRQETDRDDMTGTTRQLGQKPQSSMNALTRPATSPGYQPQPSSTLPMYSLRSPRVAPVLPGILPCKVPKSWNELHAQSATVALRWGAPAHESYFAGRAVARIRQQQARGMSAPRQQRLLASAAARQQQQLLKQPTTAYAWQPQDQQQQQQQQSTPRGAHQQLQQQQQQQARPAAARRRVVPTLVQHQPPVTCSWQQQQQPTPRDAQQLLQQQQQQQARPAAARQRVVPSLLQQQAPGIRAVTAGLKAMGPRATGIGRAQSK